MSKLDEERELSRQTIKTFENLYKETENNLNALPWWAFSRKAKYKNRLSGYSMKLIFERGWLDALEAEKKNDG